MEFLKNLYNFDSPKNGIIVGHCQLCNFPYNDKVGSTGNFHKHLKRKHKKEYSEGKKQNADDSNSEPNGETVDQIAEYEEKLNESITTNLIVKCNLTPAIIEQLGFQEFMKWVAPKWKPSSSRHIRTKIIPSLVTFVQRKIDKMLKQHFTDIIMFDIQLARSGNFTLFATDVKSFNRLLNDFTEVLAANGQPSANIYVPRSIQRIKDTEKVAFVKRVDLEIAENRIADSLKAVGFNVENVIRLTNKERNQPIRTVKIVFNDSQNRNTFLQTGLQIDSMHFVAEPAMQNIKPVQCYLCLKYNHVTKFCKTKQQSCTRCGENHQYDQCPNHQLSPKCCNCKGDHLANSFDCPTYKEQERRIQKMINQYSTTTKQTVTTTVPVLNNNDEFPPLPNGHYRQQDFIKNLMIDEIINVISSKMEKIIEETTNRLFNLIYQKINKIEKSLSSRKNLINVEATESEGEDEEIQMIDDFPPSAPITSNETPLASDALTTAPPTFNSASTSTSAPISSNGTAVKPARKPKSKTKTAKRNRSPNSSMESAVMDNKDSKTDSKG